MEIEFFKDFYIRVVGEVSMGTPDRFIMGSWEHGDAPSVRNLKVYIGDTEITQELSEDQIKEIENALILEHEEAC